MRDSLFNPTTGSILVDNYIGEPLKSTRSEKYLKKKEFEISVCLNCKMAKCTGARKCMKNEMRKAESDG